MKDIIHKYYKKELQDFKILIQLDPENYRGLELIVHTNGRVEKTKREFDQDIYDDLAADEFVTASPLEFNLYLKGLVK